jgi:hypothetical protein
VNLSKHHDRKDSGDGVFVLCGSHSQGLRQQGSYHVIRTVCDDVVLSRIACDTVLTICVSMTFIYDLSLHTKGDSYM